MSSLERRVATEAARLAGAVLCDALAATRRIAYKGSPTNLVTDMDTRAEQLVLERLTTAFPDDAILSEEAGAHAGRSGRRWIVDPLDGTTNYAHGVPIFAVSIALEVAGRIELGIVYHPSADELFVAERGRGAALDGRPLRVSATADLGASLLATGFPYAIADTRRNNLPQHAAFSRSARAVRRLGSAALDLAWVACGRLDGYWELTLGAWDLAAGWLLVEEAGGRVTDAAGGAVDLAAPSVLASNGAIHGAMLRILATEELR